MKISGISNYAYLVQQKKLSFTQFICEIDFSLDSQNKFNCKYKFYRRSYSCVSFFFIYSKMILPAKCEMHLIERICFHNV